jgi:predicted transcriptional regulator of viral defense system
MQQNNNLKALSRMAAKVVTTLYSQNRPIFHFQEVEIILGERKSADRVLGQLTKNGIATRLKGGTFRLIPFELGFETEYLGNPYLIAPELIPTLSQGISEKYYLSYGSAFDLHQMTTQPQFIVYISCSKLIRSRIIQGTEFRFIHCKPQALFGLTEMWIEKNQKVLFSDLERSLIDGLKYPRYCGGLSEVAKAFAIKQTIIDPQKLVDYALQLNVGAVFRRLGFLMELYNIGQPTHWKALQEKLTATYQLLDPELPSEGTHTAKWRLRLNISKEELLAVRET